MKKSQRIAILIFCAGVLVFLSILFWPFVMANILMPLALTAWLLLRVFILSIDQSLIWLVVILLAVIFVLTQVRTHVEAPVADESSETNALVSSVTLWRIWIQFGALDKAEVETIRRELTYLLVSIFKTRQQAVADFEVVDALKDREIPLPEPVYSFLFPAKPEYPKNPWLKRFRLIQEAPQKWIRRWSGRDLAEYYKAIDTVLKFMETSLELTHDSESFETGHD